MFPSAVVDLRRLLLETFRSPNYKPPTLPSVAMEIFALAQRPDVEFRDVSAILEADPVLAARVLRIAQSAYYSRGAPLKSISDAVARLGLLNVRNVVWEAATHTGVFQSKGYARDMEQVRRHSRVTAMVARLVCEYTSLEEGHVFLCGLLHDLGIAATLIALSEYPVLTAGKSITILWPEIDAVHEEAGGMIAHLWKLPPEIITAIGSHHGMPESELMAAVSLAERMAAELGEAVVDPAFAPPGGVDRMTDPAFEEACSRLDLDTMHISVLREEARALIQEFL